jgi:hypothetical protein
MFFFCLAKNGESGVFNTSQTGIGRAMKSKSTINRWYANESRRESNAG